MDFQTSSEPIGSLAVEGIIVGVYEDQSTTLDHPVISSNLTIGNFGNTMNKTRLLFDLEGIAAPMILLMKLGKKDEFGGEELRKLVATGARLLRKNGAKTIGVTAFGDARATAEGLSLGLYRLDELKSEVKEEQIETVTLSGNESEIADWNTGVVIADSQNKARRLGELPANIATPSYFVSETEKYFDGMDKVTVTAYDEAWASSQNMGTFLSVAKGSDEPAKFLIVEYRGGTDGEQPLGLVGKGITFDTGGINLKSAAGMYEMRVDCTGAAVVLGTLYGIAKLGLPINAVAIAPLTENMPSGKASRPSDVVVASNGKSVEIGNTDAEGRLVLSDGLVYMEKTYNPHTIVDVATLTGAMSRAIGNVYIGALSRSDDLWKELKDAGKTSGEEFWRFPLDKRYAKAIKSHVADVKSTGAGGPGQITATLYLGHFVEMERWAHIDIAGHAVSAKPEGYKPKGNTGPAVRALIQLAMNRS